jgi:hypothetical protein
MRNARYPKVGLRYRGGIYARGMKTASSAGGEFLGNEKYFG